ncbi:MAG: LysM peptidoglycan-binding domain-containing protein, partial [Anaerolineae bacterium]|nr:LysM peptidoglycan-binding domain-containing protein [Anaerolineae bacterium]
MSISRMRRVLLVALVFGLVAAFMVPAPVQAQGPEDWPGDDRLSPHPAEYYTVYCASDTVSVHLANGTLVGRFGIVSMLELASGGSFGAGYGLTIARSGDTITISGTNGNNAPNYGTKSFSLTDCVSRNGGLLAYYTPRPQPAVVADTAVIVNTPGSCTHVVTYGETLYQIATRYRVTVVAVMQANSLYTQNVYSGQVLVLPGCNTTITSYGTTTVTVTSSGTHVVQAG